MSYCCEGEKGGAEIHMDRSMVIAKIAEVA